MIICGEKNMINLVNKIFGNTLGLAVKESSRQIYLWHCRENKKKINQNFNSANNIYFYSCDNASIIDISKSDNEIILYNLLSDDTVSKKKYKIQYITRVRNY